MKSHLPALCALLFALPAPAAVVLMENVNIPLPLTLDGVYLNPATGATGTSHPVDWNTAPWINPFFGGVYVATDALLQPAITGTDQIVNLTTGTLVDHSLTYTTGESGSSTHMGAAVNQFQPGTPGYLAFRFQPTVGGDTHYGWARVTFDNDGPGMIYDYAYESMPGVGLFITSIPEPSRLVLVMIGALGLVLRRRRSHECR